jgi:hypothetical protein
MSFRYREKDDGVHFQAVRQRVKRKVDAEKVHADVKWVAEGLAYEEAREIGLEDSSY